MSASDARHPLDWDPIQISWVRPFVPDPEVLREVDVCTALHHLLWGAPQDAFVRKVAVNVEPLAGADDEELISQDIWTIHWLMSPTTAHPLSSRLAVLNHLVLREYPGMMERIETGIAHYLSSPRFRPSGSVIVGQPGIGKTQFQTYLLFERLKNRKPTILWLPSVGKYIFFHDSVSAYTDPNDVAMRVQELGLNFKDIVLLFDANGGYGPPPTVWMKAWWTVLTTSPVESRYKAWEKQHGPRISWMFPNTWDEVFVILHTMQLCQPHQINLARDAFCNAGPVLRSCIDAVQPEYKALEEFVYLRGVAIRNFLRAKVVQRVDNFSRHICSMPLDNFSDMALIAVPKLPLRVTATLRHASVAVSDQLFQVLRQERGIVAAQNWGALMQVEGVGSFSAVLFEGAVRRHFLERRLLPAHGDMRVLPYKDIRGRVDFERKGLLHSAGPVFIYATLREAAHFIASHCFDNCLLVPQAKNQATFDAFSVTWIDMKTVKLTLYQVTVGASHDLKSSALHDLRELFHYSSRIPDVDKVDLRLVFIVPPTVFDKWTEAVVPQDLTANQEVSRKTKGQEVFGGDHWCRQLAQYVVCVDINDLLQPAGDRFPL